MIISCSCDHCGHVQYVSDTVQSYRCQLCGLDNSLMTVEDEASCGSEGSCSHAGSNDNVSDTVCPTNLNAIAESSEPSDSTGGLGCCDRKMQYAVVGYSPGPYANERYHSSADICSSLLFWYAARSVSTFELLFHRREKIEERKGFFAPRWKLVSNGFKGPCDYEGRKLSTEEFSKRMISKIESIGSADSVSERIDETFLAFKDESYCGYSREPLEKMRDQRITRYQLFCTFTIDPDCPQAVHYKHAWQQGEGVADNSQVAKLIQSLQGIKDSRCVLSETEIRHQLGGDWECAYRIPEDREPLTSDEMLSVLAAIELKTNWRVKEPRVEYKYDRWKHDLVGDDGYGFPSRVYLVKEPPSAPAVQQKKSLLEV